MEDPLVVDFFCFILSIPMLSLSTGGSLPTSMYREHESNMKQTVASRTPYITWQILDTLQKNKNS